MATLKLENCARECVNFINRSPSPFHAVANCAKRLREAGFVQLSEREEWSLKHNSKYFFMRNQTTLVAFAIGAKYEAGNGIQMVAAHTDSCCPKVKPNSAVESQGYLQVGVQLYGGGLWHTWFDRDLAIAGRVMVKQPDGSHVGRLVMIDRPIMRVPTLAIHLCSSEERASFKVNNESQMVPILASAIKGALEGENKTSHHPLLVEMLAQELGCKSNEIGDFELCVYDHHKGEIGGAKEEFIFAARIDNLVSSFCSIEALIASCEADSLATEKGIRMACLFDHEECGSQSAEGAASNLLERTVMRLTASFASPDSAVDAQERAFRNSMLLSADMAHAVHPNYDSKHERLHRPVLHKGIVFKHNANQRYATNSVTTTVLREVAARCDVPLQEFVVRNDSPCGSTVGPILAAKTGIRTIDIGGGQLSMHSIREMCGTDDVVHYFNLMKGFYQTFQEIDATVSLE